MPTPPPKRKKIEGDSAEISDVLQGEIARLDQKFKVQLDPIQHMGSRTVNLICQLGIYSFYLFLLKFRLIFYRRLSIDYFIKDFDAYNYKTSSIYNN